jgi:excisionase family DNA binding protein
LERKEVRTVADSKRELLSPAEVAARLGLSRPHVYRLAADGEIRSIKFGKAVRFEEAAVERFIRAHRRDGAPKDAA